MIRKISIKLCFIKIKCGKFTLDQLYVSLIDREELQAHLDKAFGDNSYCIINRY